MWLITQLGFFSFAEKDDDHYDGSITVRSQNPKDLDRLRTKVLPGLGPSVFTNGDGYLVEAKCSRFELAAALSDLLLSVDYESLRARVKQQQLDDRLPIYSNVFDVLFGLRASKQVPNGSHLELSYGGILVDHERGVLLQKPAGEFDGYVWTFCKGQQQEGKSPTETALEHVRRKTGYEAEVLATLPEKFDGGYSSTVYFLMRPIRDSNQFDKTRTGAVKWVPLDEAKLFLAQTRNELGAKRDLRVLEATQRFLRHNATRTGWELSEMPHKRFELPFRMRFSPGEMTRIRRGHIPNEMEDRWYVYFQDGWINFHRSWTGFCIFRMRLEPDGECHRVAECWASREPEQYSNEDVAEDQKSLESLLFNYFQVGSDPDHK